MQNNHQRTWAAGSDDLVDLYI